MKLGFPFWNLENFDNFNVIPITNHKVYYKKETDDSSQVKVMVILMKVCCLWFIHTPF
jgi:hypothetical protein